MSTGVEDRIDETLADLGADGPAEPTEPAGDEPEASGDEDETAQDLDELRQQLALVLPAHTYYQPKRTQRGPIGIAIGPNGPQIMQSEPTLTGIKARWSTPEGMWRVVAVLCPSGLGLIHYEIKGPQTLLRRGDQTFDQLLDKLRAVNAV